MKFLSSLLAHIEALKIKNVTLAEELAKLRDFFEGKASADGATAVKAQNAATAASVDALHSEVDSTVSEAQAHLENTTATEEPPSEQDTLTDLPPPHPTMRAKMLVTHISQSKSPDGLTVYGEQYEMTCVGGDKVQSGYPADGTDEDNTFAKWSPSGNFIMSCNNPALFGKIVTGEKYYLDFTLANPAPVAAVPPAADPKPGEPTLTAADFPGGVMPSAAVPVNAAPAPTNPPTQQEIAAMPVASSTPTAAN